MRGPTCSEDVRRLLCELGDHVREVVIGARGMDMTVVEGATAADTIYAVDRVADDVLVEWFRGHWPGVELDDPIPVELFEAVAEVIGFVLRARSRTG